MRIFSCALNSACRSDHQRRRLAAKGVLLGPKLLAQIATSVTPETILSSHRELVGKAMTCGRRSPGRPHKSRDLAALIVKMAKDNPSWGYDRIQGALKNLGHIVAPTTIRNILRRRRLEPAPLRKPKIAWKTFLEALPHHPGLHASRPGPVLHRVPERSLNACQSR